MPMERINGMKKFAYYYSCLISGIIELGAVLWGINQGYSVSAVIGLALAYQLGNIFCFFVREKIGKANSVIIFVTICLSVALIFQKAQSTAEYIIAVLDFALISTMIQNLRSAVQGNTPRWKKRSFRVAGFLLSAIMYWYGVYCLIGLTLVLFCISLFTPKYFYNKWLKNLISHESGKPGICWAMVTHQAHYFSYNYIILILVLAYYNNPIAAALWFVGNWIPYTITEPLMKLSKFKNWLAIVIVAHLFNAIILIGMYVFFDVNIVIALCLWIFTGFGGGNVFCIKKALAKEKKEYSDLIWNFSEQIGHIIGIVPGLILSIACLDTKCTLIVGSAFALITIPIVLFAAYKSKKNDDSINCRNIAGGVHEDNRNNYGI